MKVSRKKTEYLCTNGETEWETIKIQEDEILRVTDFNFLGSTVQEDGGSDRNTEKRIQSGWYSWRKITGLLCDKRVPEKGQRKDVQDNNTTSNVV